MKLFKRWLALGLALLLVLGCMACKKEPEEPSAPAEPEGNSIDIYLIAGQSNAAGHTNVTDAEAAYEMAPALRGGCSNVFYAGNSRSDSGGKVVDRDLSWRRTKLGLGVSTGFCMGPEAGMAAALSTYYNEESGKYAGIIKMAHGGTSLLEKRTGSNAFGNWVSPSYAASLGLDWEDDPITGVLYRALLEQVREKVETLEEYNIGFTKVNIKGLYWMQGCNNRNDPGEYSKAFQFFADDLRADLAALMTELTGSDCGAAEMPIFVGTLSATFSLQNATTEALVNEPFINMQKKLEERVENCYVVDNSQYAIGRWNAETGSVEVLGSDAAHWNQADMLEIGMNVGELMLEKCLGQ